MTLLAPGYSEYYAQSPRIWIILERQKLGQHWVVVLLVKLIQSMILLIITNPTAAKKSTSNLSQIFKKDRKLLNDYRSYGVWAYSEVKQDDSQCQNMLYM